MDIFGQKNKVSHQLIQSIPLAFAKFEIEFNEQGDPYNLIINEVNELFEKIAGHSRNDLIGKKLSDIFPEFNEKMSERFKTYKSYIKNRKRYQSEIFLESINKWYDVFINVPEEDSLTILLSESTNRKNIEEEHRLNEKKFKSLYENSTIGLYRTSSTGEILLANKSLINLLGYESFEELSKRNLEKEGFDPANPRSEFKKLLEKKGEIIGYESSWITKDGNTIFIRESARTVNDKDGKNLFYEGTVENITEKKIAEIQIAALNSLFLEVGIDPAQNIQIYVKKTCEIINGTCALYNRIDYENNLLVTLSEYNAPAEILVNGDPEGHICYETTIKGKNKPVAIENLLESEYFHPDPKLKESGLKSYLGVPVIVDDETIGSLCVFSEKSKQYTQTELKIINTLAKGLSLEQKRSDVEQNLIKAIGEAKKANMVKSQFLANMSHEIRTPLNGIMGFSEMLLTQESDPKKARMLQMIEDSGNQLLQIINDIFDYSRIESGKIKLHEDNFKLRELINETVSFFDQAYKSKELQVIVNLDGITENNLFGDYFKFRQILINVIDNAIKFTDEGSIIVIAESKLTDSKVQVNLIVEDTGIGINSDQIETIFDEFKQLEYYLTKQIKGTGLGLTISKKLLDLLSGTINVESEPGKGSRFIINLPFKTKTKTDQKNKEVISKPMELREEKNKTVKILLAEDNEANQFLIKAITKSKDWDITVVDDGDQAVEQFKKDKFDLVLMDVQMPVMNGYEATKLIREFEVEKGTHTPIIALTAYAMKSDRDLCLEAGMDDYISKPFKRQQFLDKIAEVIDKD
ncbi:MAG: response regulator [Bacteroidales bacterium]|nr:response regulator [Bacteroidales bacterium]